MRCYNITVRDRATVHPRLSAEPAPAVTGYADADLRATFPDVEVAGHGHTWVLTAEVDQSALHGLLHRIRTLPLDIVDVTRRRDHGGRLRVR